MSIFDPFPSRGRKRRTTRKKKKLSKKKLRTRRRKRAIGRALNRGVCALPSCRAPIQGSYVPVRTKGRPGEKRFHQGCYRKYKNLRRR